MSDAYRKALDQMRDFGLLVDEIIADGRYHHVKVEGSKAGKKSGTYICSQINLNNGDVALVGAFWNWKASEEKQVIKPEAAKLTREEKEQLEAARKIVLEASEKERQAKAYRAATLAPKLWEWAREDRASKYLWRKKVAALGVRVDRHGNVLVPVRDWDGRMVGLQFIPGEPGEIKKFLTGTPKQGNFLFVGSIEGNGPIAFAEGYATGASVHMATRWPVFVCFDAGNLEAVVVEARKRYPDRVFVIAGDDDHEAVDKDGKPDNKGRKKAMAAAKATRAHLALPKFRRAKGQTDWNDLHVAEGIDRVGELLRAALQEEPVGGDPPTPPPPMGDSGHFDFSLGALLSRFTLVCGTTTVYDSLDHKLWELTALRVAATNKIVSRWQKHPERKNVRLEDVVFEPDTRRCAEHQVNLFRGMPLEAKAGDCGEVLELLHYLCGQDDAVYDWVLKWIAYPLQNVGAKMQSSIIMHGPEGTGKNVFWGVVADLYGDYAVQISQNQLDSKFNGWASAKLFAVGNEVVSRTELYHTKGGLKTMITERRWIIEEKHMPARTESNHTNFVFLSNVLQPVAPDPDDRHYMILWTPGPREASFYKAVADQIEAGGREAFYQHLLTLDLKGFNEHSKPLLTEAKTRLIEISMDTPERFWREWSAGELPKWPYLPAPSMDVYRIYYRWCEARGEKPLREAVFSNHMHRHMFKLPKRYMDHSRQKEGQKRFLIPRDWRPPQGKTEVEAFTECVEDFFRSARDEADHVP